MNKFAIRTTLLSLMAVVLTISACVKGDFDEPPIYIPTVDFESNTTIAGLKAMYTGDLGEISDDVIIKGKVVANDESGNLYKKLVIQDETAGIEVLLNKVSLYNEYKLGQLLYIKCKGMYLGDYGGLIQLGYNYENKIGQLPEILIPDHLFRDSLPGNVPEAVKISLTASNTQYLDMLVYIESATFTDGGKATWATADATTNRTLTSGGKSIIVRTSNYANFALETIPAGTGTVYGILTTYNNTPQLTIRDTSDVKGFTSGGGGGGGTSSILLEEAFDVQPSTWVTFSVASTQNWNFDASYKYMWANGYGGDAGADDWLITPDINFAGSTDDSISFRAWTKYTDTGLSDPLTVLISTNYSGSGDPTGATWTPLTITLPAANSAAWTDCKAAITGMTATARIAFRYKSSGTGSNSSSKWEVDSVKVTGKL